MVLHISEGCDKVAETQKVLGGTHDLVFIIVAAIARTGAVLEPDTPVDRTCRSGIQASSKHAAVHDHQTCVFARRACLVAEVLQQSP